MIISRLFCSLTISFGLCFAGYLVFGGSFLMWLLVGWLLSAPLVLLILLVEHSAHFKAWRADQSPRYAAPDRRPVTNKSTVFKKI